MVHRLVNAGALTNRFYAAHGLIPSDWAQPDFFSAAPNPDSILLYNYFVIHRLTGVKITASGDPIAHVQVERSMLAEAEATGLSPAALRERGNQHTRSEDWVNASHAYSLALVLCMQSLDSAAVRLEAAKAAANRSFAHLKLAKLTLDRDPVAAGILEKNARLMLRVAEAKARGTGRMGERFLTSPDLMARLRGGTLLQAATPPRRIEPWRMFAILAFADADRADVLALHWAKPIAREAEAARFLATQSAREGEEHGLRVMGGLASEFYKHAAERETSAVAKKQYEQLSVHMREVYAVAVRTPLYEDQGMREAVATLEQQHGITLHELQRAGFAMPPPRVAEENRRSLFSQSLYGALRNSCGLLSKYMRDPIAQANAAPRGAAGEWWSMAYPSAGVSAEGEARWVITVVDSTEVSVPPGDTEGRGHAGCNQIRDQTFIPSERPPSGDEIKFALFRAILLPVTVGCWPRRPQRVRLAWSMRQSCAALKEVGARIGIKVSVGERGVSLPAEDEQNARLAVQGVHLRADDDRFTGG